MSDCHAAKISNDEAVDRISAARRTSPCVTAVRNMGVTPRLYPPAAGDDVGADDLPQLREERNCMPSHTQARKLLSKCIELPEYAHWSFDEYFDKAALVGKQDGDVEICCQTPVRWIEAGILGPNSSSVWHHQDVEITRMCTMGDMFSENGARNPFHHEVFVMDVILNRAMCEPSASTPKMGEKKELPTVDPDQVVMVRCFKPENQDASVDWKFRTMICFIPAAGVFYCLRERRRKDVGIENTMIPFDMSWLRMRRHIGVDGKAAYGFADGGYVRRFSTGLGSCPKDNRIPVWRIRSCRHDRMERIIYRALQCHDCEGPKMAPDVAAGQSSSKPPEALAAEYNSCLAKAKSAKANGRHYANGWHYSGRLQKSCLIIDPKVDPCVDIMIDVAATGCCTDRQTTVMIRHLLGGDKKQTETKRRIRRGLRDITFHNTLVRERMGSVGTVRASGGDYGKMYAIGTRVHLNGNVIPYGTNNAVPQPLLRKVVVAMCDIGRYCFPEVVSVIQDVEGDTGMPPVSPMDGSDPLKVLAVQKEVAPLVPSNVATLPPLEEVAVDNNSTQAKCLREKTVMFQRRQRVGYTIDMSVNLGNTSHYDVHDASQGFSVWTEEHPGVAKDWYFIMPNVHGRRLDGSSFAGVAIKLHHGTAISWDGRVVRHCTSITMPDGIDGRSPLDSHRKGDFANHVYGTFTAAKERIVQAGRKFAAAAAASMTEGETPIGDAEPVVEGEPAVIAEEVQIEGLTDVPAFWDSYVIPKKQRRL